MRDELRKLSNSIRDEGITKTARLAARQLHQDIKNRSSSTIRRLVQETVFRYNYGVGTEVIKEDWDNLIILDACRTMILKNSVD